MKRWLIPLSLLAALGSGRAAAEEPPAIALVSVEIAGDAAPELRGRVARSIAAGLAGTGARAVGLEAVMDTLSDSPELLGCTSTACLARISELVDADRFVHARIGADGAAYTIELSLLSAADDDGVIRRLDDACTVCTITELHGRVRSAAEALLEPGQPAPVDVVIESRPPGAQLAVGEDLAAEAPYRGKLPAGTYEVVANLSGHDRATETIEVERDADGPQRFVVVMVPEGQPVTRDEPAPARPYRIWKWVAAGSGVAAIATGALLIGLDGRATCETEPPRTQCAEELDTKVGGLVTVGAGLALGGASGWMFYRDHEREASLSAGPTSGGRGAVGAITVQF